MRRHVKPVAYAPGALTTGNLFLGFSSIVCSFNDQFLPAAWMIIIGGFLDLLDGKVARLSDNDSRFGAELDSMADMITFGLAPIMLVYKPVLQNYGKIGLLIGFFYIMCGAFRLARFNIQPPKKEKSNFTGLPIPTAAGLIASFILFTNELFGEPGFVWPMLIIFLTITMGVMMISSIEYICFPKFSWKTGKSRAKLILFLIYFCLLAIFPAYVFFPTAVMYLLSGLIAAPFSHFHHDLEEEMSEINV
ncbi:MAG: CDP-diacylglycerol--serine O-phosphatidyltransferase [Candidatus Cloacimonetes bacterium 4572_55]|nr:MAG: CDP-diacylglycerol--serine O-phosphatidyltransferase [Candidatus Cloacimonetes bacterium 4572_55]